MLKKKAKGFLLRLARNEKENEREKAKKKRRRRRRRRPTAAAAATVHSFRRWPASLNQRARPLCLLFFFILFFCVNLTKQTGFVGIFGRTRVER